MSLLRTVLARVRALRRSAQADPRSRRRASRVCGRTGPASYERRGMAPAEAKRAALIEVEGVEQVKERVRDVRLGSAGSEAAARDARYGARVLWRSPGYAPSVVILTLALGVGPNVASSSAWCTPVLWRSPPLSGRCPHRGRRGRHPGVAERLRDRLALYSTCEPRAGWSRASAQVEGRDASLEDFTVRRSASPRPG